MYLTPQQGTLIRWEDDRGFGFIQPDDSGANVFVHITQLRRAIRRPQVGDRLTYTVQTQANGKTRAIDARLLGVPLPPLPYPSPSLPSLSISQPDASPSGWRNALRFIGAFALLGSLFYAFFLAKKSDVPQRKPSVPVARQATISHPKQAKVTAPRQAKVSRSRKSKVSALRKAKVSPSYSNDAGSYLDDTAPQNDNFPPQEGWVKGNISVNNGRRYYHTPGMPEYDITTINLSQGERWFRTEAEAIAAGWTKAPIYQGRNP